MRMKTVSLLAGVSVPLILASTASGAFIGLKWFHKFVDPADIAADTNIPGVTSLLVTNVYATFTTGDAAGEVVGVGGSAALGILLEINTRDGTFFQHPFGAGNYRSPSAALASLPGFNSVKHDSFVTIGRKLDDDPIDGADQTQIFCLDTWTDTQLTGSNEVDWFTFGRTAQSFPGQGPDNQPDQVLIGQYTVANPGPNGGVFGSMFVNFFHTNAAGFVEQITITGIFDTHLPGGVCIGDIDANGAVEAPDLLTLLSVWGLDPGGPPDLDGDGVVAVPDLLMLLSAWGPCP